MNRAELNTVLNLLKSDLSKKQLKKVKVTLESTLKISECNLNNEGLIQEFKTNKSSVGIKATTLAAYELELKTFLSSMKLNFYDVTTNDVRNYIANYKETHSVSETTIQNKLHFLSSFFDYMKNMDYMDKNPVDGIEKVRIERKLKKPFSDSELQLLRDNSKDSRERALVEFLYSTGARLNEAINLKVSDIDLKEKEAIVFGKGHKERKVYLSDSCVLYLKKYFKTRSSKPDSLLFSSNKKGGTNKLTARGVQKMLKDLGTRSGVTNVHPHRFRRTMATNALKNGIPIEQIKVLLGHSRIDTTMIYCSISDDKVKSSYRANFK